MKFMPFYKLYDWILEECGASAESALIAIIYSFDERGAECRLSYSQFAEVLKVSRCNAITRINRLIEAGYISCITNSTHTNTYSVNRSAFTASIENDTSNKNTSIENDTSDNSASIENDTSDNSASIENDTRLVSKTILGGIENDTSTSIENDTQIEVVENLIDSVTEAAEPQKNDSDPDTGHMIPHGKHQKVMLTAEQYMHLQFGTKCAKGKSIELYVQKLDDILTNKKARCKDHYRKILEWTLADGGCELGQAEEKQNREYAQNTAAQRLRYGSSIDMNDVERLMNQY